MCEVIRPPKPKSITKMDELQKQLAQSKKIKTQDEEVEELIVSKNESMKDKKIRELAQKNKSLMLSYEREKAW